MATYDETVTHDMAISATINYLQVKAEEALEYLISAGDMATRQVIHLRTVEDELVLVEVVVHQTVYDRIQSDTITLSQTVGGGFLYVNVVSQSLTLNQGSEDPPTEIAQALTFSETVIGTSSHLIGQSITLTEVVLGQSVVSANISHTITLSQGVTGGAFDSDGGVISELSDNSLPSPASLI